MKAAAVFFAALLVLSAAIQADASRSLLEDLAPGPAPAEAPGPGGAVTGGGSCAPLGETCDDVSVLCCEPNYCDVAIGACLTDDAPEFAPAPAP
ncbi:hypothetical protein ABPG75_012779 [Micractinium tetrahymenae]